MPLNTARLHQTFLTFVTVPSPSRQERVAADWLLARVRGMGYEAREDKATEKTGGNAGNILVLVPATAAGPKLVLSAHMDTVETGEAVIEPVVDGDTVTSAGDTILAADDKCGCAVLLELLQCLKEETIPHGELLFIFSVSEEIECLGASALDPAVYEGFDAGIVLDHASPDEIVIGAPTKASLQITVHGVGGHGASPTGKVNAAHALATTLSRLPSGRLDEHTTCNLGVMRSGSKINVIPGEAYAEYEIRSHRDDLMEYHLQNALTTVEAAVRQHRTFLLQQDTGLSGEKDSQDNPIRHATVDVEVNTCYECYRHEADALPVQVLETAIRACGKVPTHVVAQGGSDANILNARGLPTAVLGCGMHSVHGTQEWASLSEIERAARVMLRAIQPTG